MTQHSWYGNARKRWEYFAAIGSIEMALRCMINLERLAEKRGLPALSRAAGHATNELNMAKFTAEYTTKQIQREYKKG